MKLLKKHRQIILQLLLISLLLTGAVFLTRHLAGIWGFLIHLILMIVGGIFFGTIVVFFLLQIIQNFRYERAYLPGKMMIRVHRSPSLNKYRIINPLEVSGSFRKTQLHAHSSLSYDSKLPPEKVIESYRKDGYEVLAITDHDRFSDFSNYSSPKMLILPGIEETVPVFFWPIPLGKHLILINPGDKRAHSGTVQQRLDQAEKSDSLVIPAHLNWRGGAGTGRWFPKELEKLKKLQFIEIYSNHSKDPADLILWHKLNLKNGPEHSVWGVAVDDSHKGSSHRGWIMLKTERLDLRSVIESLKRGAFYATRGPSNLDIQVADKKILVTAPDAAWIRFINAQNKVISATRGEQAVYQSYGDEIFIRVEVTNHNDRTAWSQPMWLAPE